LEVWKSSWHKFIRQDGNNKSFRLKLLYWLYGQVWQLSKAWVKRNDRTSSQVEISLFFCDIFILISIPLNQSQREEIRDQIDGYLKQDEPSKSSEQV
jgi:hypothetical protein